MITTGYYHPPATTVMNSLPPPTPPRAPPNADADAAVLPPLHSASSDSDSNYGPVTKLAAIAAARDEEARIQKRALDQAAIAATASLVGETALAIAAANASGSPLRLSPAQQQTVARDSPLLASKKNSPNRSPPGGAGPRMSVAARARAAADVPSVRRSPPRMPAIGGAVGGGGSSRAGSQRAPSSGGVMRGKFSKAQVEQLIDQWGREDTDEDDDYYYDDDSSGADNYEGYDQYKQSLERAHHHLQYTTSQSPGPTAGESASSGEEEFHYQHHRVSAYSTAVGNMFVGGGSTVSPRRRDRSYHNQQPHDDEEESIGLFASARNWIQSQRDRLHQIELERQVEDQRRKLVDEGRRQRALEAERRRRNASASQNNNNSSASANRNQTSTNNNNRIDAAQAPSDAQPREIEPFGSNPDDTAGEAIEDLCKMREQDGAVISGYSNFCGFGGAYADQPDDSSDYSGVARVDSLGNILEIVPSGSMESVEGEVNVCMKVSSPKCTLSGKGMSVKVDLPEDDEYGNNHDGNAAMDENCNNEIRKHGEEGEKEEEAEDDQIVHFESDVKIVPEPAQDEVSTSPQILQQSQMKALIASGGLPPSLNFCKWKRLYSLTRDGDSFEQFLRLVEGHDRTVLVVKTTTGGLFGGYADTRWEGRHSRRQLSSEFYGSAQACLFRFPDHGSGKREDRISVYRWTGANRYVQLCDAARRTVAFGGGGRDGVFGLCIEDDFRRGTTGHCSTFENEPLCEEGYFDILDLEVWGFALDYF